MSKPHDKLKMVQHSQIDPAKIDGLIANLNSSDGLVRHKARNALVRIGEPAIEPLIKAWDSRDDYSHWQVAKALSLIGNAKSVQVLIETLKDDDFGIRWIAAEGLITVGRAGLESLLQALVNQADSVRLREGAHHVIHDLISRELLPKEARQAILPVFAALEDVAPTVTVPIAAHEALRAFKE